jgi:hypothetical protein
MKEHKCRILTKNINEYGWLWRKKEELKTQKEEEHKEPATITEKKEKNWEEKKRKIIKTFPKACLRSRGKSNITFLFVALRFRDKGEGETSKWKI